MAIHDVEHCDCHEVHKDLVDQVMNRMPDEDELYEMYLKLHAKFGGMQL